MVILFVSHQSFSEILEIIQVPKEIHSKIILLQSQGRWCSGARFQRCSHVYMESKTFARF